MDNFFMHTCWFVYLHISLLFLSFYNNYCINAIRTMLIACVLQTTQIINHTEAQSTVQKKNAHIGRTMIHPRSSFFWAKVTSKSWNISNIHHFVIFQLSEYNNNAFMSYNSFLYPPYLRYFVRFFIVCAIFWFYPIF